MVTVLLLGWLLRGVLDLVAVLAVLVDGVVAGAADECELEETHGGLKGWVLMDEMKWGWMGLGVVG